ncbi:hypothetical protein C8R44DRAFT_812280, partial [Mycena epipterygia]
MLASPLTYVSALFFLVCTNALVLPQMPGRDIHIERSAVRALEVDGSGQSNVVPNAWRAPRDLFRRGSLDHQTEM